MLSLVEFLILFAYKFVKLQESVDEKDDRTNWISCSELIEVYQT